MVRISAIILLAFLFSSCANKSDNSLAVFKAANEGFLYSNNVISNSNDVIYKQLDFKLTEPQSIHQAMVWQPKALLIKQKSKGLMKYLDSLIIELKKEAGLRLIMENIKEVYDEDDVDAANRLFIDKNIGYELFKKLQKYKNDILAVDPEMDKQFRDNLIIITRDFEKPGIEPKNFATTFFDHVPAIAAVTMLRKLEHNIGVLENMFISYCNSKIPSDGWNLLVTVPLINQSSNSIKGGGEMEIIAGVGAYYSQAHPKITINNIVIAFDNSQGFGKYKFKTPLKMGKYTIPVKIEYTDDIGRRQVVKEKLEYTVIE